MLRQPEIVEKATERALRGEDVHADERFGGRFEREREPEREVVSRAGERRAAGTAARLRRDARGRRRRSSRA